ncbi:hypothetical protein [Komagataeibacter swingsii]|uniref:hypothetical protein n=1 Tax=Komagataeibacter swingsii TaxID=215220 RepID=UPI00142DCE89|nr:hypothetical protein [Komagataeibacter swingsii]
MSRYRGMGWRRPPVLGRRIFLELLLENRKKVFGEAFFKKLRKNAALFKKKVTLKNFYCFLSMSCFQTASQGTPPF